MNNLKEIGNHKFIWSSISNAPENILHRKILEAYYIKMLNPVLNEQLDNDNFPEMTLHE